MTDAEALALAVAAAAHWGGCVVPPRLIKNRENAVFEVHLPMGRAALRLHRPGYQSAGAIASELWWISELARAGLRVPTAHATRGGDHLADLGGGQVASVIAWVEGEAIGAGGVPLAQDADAQRAVHRDLGALLAQVHAATDRLRLPPGFTRPDWGLEGLLGETPFWGRFWDHPALSADEAALLRAARSHARDRLAGYGGSQGLIHADVLRENVFVHEGRVTLIDFDDSGFGYRLYDLGTALRDNLIEPQGAALAEALVEGYASLRPLTGADRALIPLFVLLRCLASVGWTMPRLPADDPRARVHIDRALHVARRVLAGAPLFG